MRPIKELLHEEYWNIAYRTTRDDEFIFKNKNKNFKTLTECSRYWYADPFVFEHNGEIFLFTEAFDNVTEKGLIACSKFDGVAFSDPQIVLEEDFHLSYPFVYEDNGEVFMMPETMADGCVQLYRAIDFPYKWERHKVLLKLDNAVDTVMHEGKLIVSVVTDSAEKRVDVDVYDAGSKLLLKSLHKNSQQARGAGRIFCLDGQTIRPAQDCTGGIYGAGLVFYQLEKADDDFSEKCAYTLKADEFCVSGKKAEGVHTYARLNNIEILDFRRRRFNLRRILWIIKKKL